jgi:respiratory nitrate reductase gamma subunit
MTVLATSRGAWLLWVILPYLAIATFVVGHVWRWRTDQFQWTTRSTQLLEPRLLKFASPLFHYGLLAVIGGHIIGILIPQSWTSSIGISENTYRYFSATAGTLAGAAVLLGLLLLIVRRVRDMRVRATTGSMDVLVLALLAVMVATGMWNTSIHNLIEGGYNYRQSISPWFRGVFLLHPNPSLATATGVPLSYQLHAIAGWLVIMIWPFTRLVHAWSVPLTYLRRAPILYRSRAPRSVRAGAAGIAPARQTTALDGQPLDIALQERVHVG